MTEPAPQAAQRTMEWQDGEIVTVDQSALPASYREVRLGTVSELIEAIRALVIRGAPALGAAGALGVALSARIHSEEGSVDRESVRADAERIAGTRPTAVNLGWGVERALGRLDAGAGAVLAEALDMLDEDEHVNRLIASRAADFALAACVRRPLRVLTHCHTGRLAAVAVGTALGAIRELAARGQLEEVLVGETRPLLQGSRLTAWELAEAGIKHRLCVDSAGPAAIAAGMADCVIVGADRIAANGDVANKIGTYSLALAADRAGLPLVVAAPESTCDERLATGAQIVVEERPAREVTHVFGQPVAPAGTDVFNPAFDVTPAELVTAIVTESRIIRPGCRERRALLA
jgi:S-methyl-5-thioribose-1-phosphate isomerase